MNPFGKLLLISKSRDSVSLLCALRAEGSSSSVQEVLKELDLLQYYPTLVHQEIDMAALRHVGGTATWALYNQSKVLNGLKGQK